MYAVPLVFLAVGVYLFLRNSGHATAVRLPPVLGLVLLWGAFEGGAFLLADSSSAVTSSPGPYGGWVGWAIGDGLTRAIGFSAALAVLLFLTAAGVFLVLGLTLDDHVE